MPFLTELMLFLVVVNISFVTYAVYTFIKWKGVRK